MIDRLLLNLSMLVAMCVFSGFVMDHWLAHKKGQFRVQGILFDSGWSWCTHVHVGDTDGLLDGTAVPPLGGSGQTKGHAGANPGVGTLDTCRNVRTTGDPASPGGPGVYF
jgi:hypothetical protein